MSKINPETVIQREIRDTLEHLGYLVLRLPVGQMRLARGYTFNTGIPNGTPDLLAIAKSGQASFIEVKTKTGRLRDDQDKWAKSYADWGFNYGVARSADDAIKICKGEF
ncbi:VRR-NUC domain-containing protein [Loigolactobacillus backii]|uniref:VRR-NUC domain-containing protein n=1 Tax=Loigolactobacillus backii TaxID=375175 RepID=UPI0007F131B3|nr:VRR-NUC domain-containing protein [Loigolactobacillus backii]ANK59842.1 hypothetical protein AYR52_05950 [Loigolactobacillus backii]